jgi:predicted RND superfamily exporter protein
LRFAEEVSLKRLDQIGIAFAVISIVFCVFGLSRLQSNTEDVLQWLPDESNARQQYDFFQQRFGSDDFLIVTWKDCQVDDIRLALFSQHLRENDTDNLIQTVANGAEVAERLSRDLKLSRKDTARRLRGFFLGSENTELTCVFVELSKRGTARRSDSMGLIWEAVAAVPGLERHDVALGGYPYIATYIDGQLKNSFRHFLLPSVLLATLVSLLCLRNLALTLIVFVTAVGAGSASIALVPICGMKYGGLMAIIPALVFVLATSGSIHLIRYGLDVIGEPRKLLAIGWKPCTISALTTAVGMLSLTRSSFPAIRNFGFFCAAGVCFALAFQLIMVPWLLSRFGSGGLTRLAARSGESTFWPQLMEQIGRRKRLISAASVLGMVVGTVGLTKLVAEVEVEKLFQPGSEILMSLAEMEKRLGPMDQTELLVVFDHADSACFADHANLVRQIQAALVKLPQIGVAHSLVNFLPNEPRSSNARSFFKRATYRDALQHERTNLANGNMLSIEGDSETWRICLRFAFTEKSDFGKLARDVTETSTTILERPENLSSSEAKPQLIYTGKTHLFHSAQVTLLHDLFLNFLLAFVIITPILIIVLRSVPLGLIAMLPNVFPTLVVFGWLGWVGYPIDLAIAMTACIALGIAVDDTTHFLIRFRDFGGRLDNVAMPIKKTIAQCGPAMLSTTLIGSAGLMVYYFSDMLVVSRFSWAITVLLLIALLADVIMLPAILFLFGSSPRAEIDRESPRVRRVAG